MTGHRFKIDCKINKLKYYLIAFCILPLLSAERGDTLTIYPITFSTPSPKGWNAQYKTTAHFPNTDGQWAKILMVQTLKCDSLTAGDKYPCGEWDYIWSTFVDVPKGDSTEQFCLGSFVTPYGKRLEIGRASGWERIYDISEYALILNGAWQL